MRPALALMMVLGCSGPAAPSQPAVTPEPPTPTTRADEPPPAQAPAPAELAPPPPEVTGAPPAGRVAERDLEPAVPSPGRKTESQSEIAARVNAEGRKAALAGKYDVASTKFREAVARVPEPGYFFNLCTSLFQEGKFGEALTACNAVANQSPTDALATKTQKLIERVLGEAKRQKIEIHPASRD
jgi:hypothetical protein